MNKKVGVVIFLVMAFVGMFLVSGSFTGMSFFGGSWFSYGEESVYGGGYFGGYGNSILDLYYSYAEWIDFLLFTALFLIIAQFVFGKKLGFGERAGRGLAIIVSVILALSLSLWEARNGVFLLDWLGPYILFILILAFIFLILFVFKSMGGSMVFWVSLAYIIFYLGFLRDVLGLFYHYRYYNLLYYNYFLDQLTTILFFASIFGLIIGMIMWKKGSKKKEG